MFSAQQLSSIFPASGHIPAEFDLAPVTQDRYLIDGELRHWNGPMREVLSPVCVRTEGPPLRVCIGSFPALSTEIGLDMLDAAARAYDHGNGRWPTSSVEERIEHIVEFAYQMKQKRSDVIKILMWEIGKSFQDSAKEFDRTLQYIQETVDALKTLDRTSSRFLIEQGIIGQIRRAPLGVVLCMGPFNYPLNETFTTLIPALIMGNTVVFKPPKYGALLFEPLLEAFRSAFPAGVVNTACGEGRTIAGPLMASGKVDVLAFIGTSRVADTLKKQHPNPHRLRSVLGLDAKNPAIILPDADIDLAVQECILGSLSFNGQRCTALKILFVHSSIAQAFTSKLADAIGNLKCGMPWETDVNITPLPEQGKVDYLDELVTDAKKLGAKVINPDGGAVSGTFFYPAALYPVSSKMRVYSEEQFGPIVPVVPFEDISEPMRYITESNYGQQVSLFGHNPDTLAKLIDPLVNQVCRVNINSQSQRGPDTFPFTGRKDSAEGTLSISDALRVFSIRTLVAAKANEINKAIITRIVRENKSSFLSTNFIF